MIDIIETNLYKSPSPLEWATVGSGVLFTAQIPIDEYGSVVDGGIEKQTRQTLENLKHTLECANTSMSNVAQVLIYVTDRSHLGVVNKVYADYFKEPYPNRAAMVITALAREEMLVEMIAYAVVDK